MRVQIAIFTAISSNGTRGTFTLRLPRGRLAIRTKFGARRPHDSEDDGSRRNFRACIRD